MSVFIPVANAAQLTLQFSQSDTSFAENEFWVKRSAAWTSAELQTMADGLITWYGTGGGGFSYKAFQSTTTKLTGVGYRDMTTQFGLTGIRQTGCPIAGTNVIAAPQLGLTFSMTARTGLAGKSNRGRSFLVGICNDALTSVGSNTIAAAWAAEAVTMMDSLITQVPVIDATCTLVVCSRYGGVPTVGGKSVPRLAGVTQPVIAYGFHNLLVDFQRRRAPGHNRGR